MTEYLSPPSPAQPRYAPKERCRCGKDSLYLVNKHGVGGFTIRCPTCGFMYHWPEDKEEMRPTSVQDLAANPSPSIEPGKVFIHSTSPSVSSGLPLPSEPVAPFQQDLLVVLSILDQSVPLRELNRKLSDRIVDVAIGLLRHHILRS